MSEVLKDVALDYLYTLRRALNDAELSVWVFDALQISDKDWRYRLDGRMSKETAAKDLKLRIQVLEEKLRGEGIEV